jgi:hypothetical protein
VGRCPTTQRSSTDLDRIAELVALGELILRDAVARGPASRSRLERPYVEA